ncbi:hypothetical protein C2G38_2261977 [Gigaspora rosea]|uniref:Tyr recombinase domain-containing protein n=1 Tax=Gigaspora rosea TaxID=44941 RepID=A0A397UM45_9GLOM|nr:hypothetical protein C2G38_2261977 [Gigaspora rosea]
MPNSKVKPKAKLKHGDVIHAISSSGNKNVANNAISTVNKSARTSKVKRKAFPTKEHMEESSVNSCNGSNVTVEFCSNWFYGQAMGEKKLRTYFRVICESTDIQFGGRNLSNYSERKTAVQVLKELGYSDAVVMSIMRHKSQKGLASYEQQKSTMQQEGLNRFLKALTFINKHEESLKENKSISSSDGNFVSASSLFKRGSSIVSLAGHINMLEVDDYEPPGTTSDYDEPPEANTNKPPEASTNDTPGATTSDAAGATCTYKPLQPQIRNVLGEIEPRNPAYIKIPYNCL